MKISDLKEWNTFEAFKTPEDVILYLKVLEGEFGCSEDFYCDVIRLIESYDKFKKND